jgi:tetratricopeptide (TPR) repeat protein
MRGVSIVVMVVVAAVAPAAAQPAANTALAEQLFNEGRDLGKANNWAQACPKFEQSLRYDPALGTRLNLATCYEKIGRLASAWGEYRQAADLAAKTGDTKRRAYALERASALEPRIPRLVIAGPKTAPPGLVVQRDGTPIDVSLLGTALFVDPGRHEVTASAPGFAPFEGSITVAEATSETLTVAELVPQPGEPAKPTSAVRPSQPEIRVRASPARRSPYVAIGLAAGGAVLASVGFAFGAKAGSTYDQATKLCGNDLACDNQDDFTRGKELISHARSQATISTIAVIAGGVAIAGGAVLYVTTRKRLVPMVTGHDAGVAMVGRF